MHANAMAKVRKQRFGAAVAGLAAILLASGAALAQQPPRPAAPRPAQPAQPAPAPAAPAQPGEPSPIVALKPEPSQDKWLKVCGEDPGNKAKICYTTRDFVADNNQPVLAVAIYDVQGQPTKVARFLMPLGFLIGPGIRFGIDGGAQIDAKYAICFPNGCFAEAQITAALVEQMKKGKLLNINAQNQVARVVTFQVPLDNFGAGFDGAPIDPKILEEEQKKLANELEKRSEEMRQKLGTPAAPGTPGAPVPAAPGPVPAAPRP